MSQIETFRSTATLLQEARKYPLFPNHLPPLEIREGSYVLRFAKNLQERDAALRLRFEVFNLELGEGLQSSFQTGLDRDSFDTICHHLLVIEESSQRVVGTYRLQSSEMAEAGLGFYSATEFDLSRFPVGVLKNSVELGRACVDKEHRNTQVLFLLWQGLARYVAFNYKRYFFGCCSIKTQDEMLAQRTFEFLDKKGHLHPVFSVPAQTDYQCSTNQLSPSSEPVILPTLFKTYLRFGAKVCGRPAIDRAFKTVDFLVIFDVDTMSERTRQIFFS